MSSPVLKPAAIAAAAVGVRALSPVRPVAAAARALVAAGPEAAASALQRAEPDLVAEILMAASVEEAAARLRGSEDEIRKAAFVRLLSEFRLGQQAPAPLTPEQAKARQGGCAQPPYPGVPWATRQQVREWRQVFEIGAPRLRSYLTETVEAKGEITRRAFFRYAAPRPGPKPPAGAPPAAVSALDSRPLDVEAIRAVAYQRLAVLREPVTPFTTVQPEQLMLLILRDAWTQADRFASLERAGRERLESFRALRDALNPLLSRAEAAARDRCGPDKPPTAPKKRATKPKNKTPGDDS